MQGLAFDPSMLRLRVGLGLVRGGGKLCAHAWRTSFPVFGSLSVEIVSVCSQNLKNKSRNPQLPSMILSIFTWYLHHFCAVAVA